MQLLDETEWLESVRLKGEGAAVEFASDILETLSDNRTDDFYEVEAALLKAAKKEFADAWRMADFFVDRHNLLDELCDTLDKAGFPGNPGDALQALLDELEELREAVKAAEPEPLKAPLQYDL